MYGGGKALFSSVLLVMARFDEICLVLLIKEGEKENVVIAAKKKTKEPVAKNKGRSKNFYFHRHKNATEEF